MNQHITEIGSLVGPTRIQQRIDELETMVTTPVYGLESLFQENILKNPVAKELAYFTGLPSQAEKKEEKEKMSNPG
jgi:hypothetical protein